MLLDYQSGTSILMWRKAELNFLNAQDTEFSLDRCEVLKGSQTY